jgi:septum formation protein
VNPVAVNDRSVPDVILASSSRYRRELLQRLIRGFRSQSPHVDERSFQTPGIDPEQLARTLAYEKARALAIENPESLVIGSDQLVDLNQTVLGKPGSVEAAVEQLMSMAGQSHRLITAVCVLHDDRKVEFSDVTVLTMRSLTREEATRYVERDQPLDCAGSYKIESLGISLFHNIQTNDFTAIMGLPLIQLSHVLREAGMPIP